METKFTPGPWSVHWNDPRPLVRNIRPPHGSATVAEVFGQSVNEVEHNANLIAAAPDLLKALAAVLSHLEYHTGEAGGWREREGERQAATLARVAIAKAKGGAL